MHRNRVIKFACYQEKIRGDFWVDCYNIIMLPNNCDSKTQKRFFPNATL